MKDLSAWPAVADFGDAEQVASFNEREYIKERQMWERNSRN